MTAAHLHKRTVLVGSAFAYGLIFFAQVEFHEVAKLAQGICPDMAGKISRDNLRHARRRQDTSELQQREPMRQEP